MAQKTIGQRLLGTFRRGVRFIGRRLGFDFLDTRNRRRDLGSDVKPLWLELDEEGRRKALVLARHMYQNSPICKWAVDFHVNNTTNFFLQPRSTDTGLNRALVEFYEQFNATADVTGRYTFDELIQQAEYRRTLDGDVLLVRIADGTIQVVQGEFLISPREGNGWYNGVQVDAFGRPLCYRVDPSGYSKTAPEASIIDARNAILHAYYDRRADSYRGVTPLSSVLSTMMDVMEVNVYTMDKMKVEAVLALAFKSTGSEAWSGFDTETTPQGETQVRSASTGVNIFELGEGEEMQTFSPSTPHSTFKDYNMFSIQLILKALGIPLTLYSENLSNYYSSRAAYMMYEDHIKGIVRQNAALKTKLFRWALALGVASGNFRLPYGMTADQVPFAFVQQRQSALDMDREMKGYDAAVKLGAYNIYDVCNRLGTTFEDNLKMNAQAKKAAENAGVTYSWFGQPDSSQETNEVSETADVAVPV